MKLIRLLLICFSAIATEQVLISAGEFQMGCSKNDEDCDIDEGPEGGVTVFVSAFKIDIQEVSVTDYKKCVKAGAWELAIS